MARTRIGLDIGTRSVHVAELAETRSGWTVRNFGGMELRTGAVRDGEIADPDEVATVIRALMGATGIRGRDVVLGVANQRVIVREVSLPAMTEPELRSSIAFQVQEYLPISVEDARIDFHVMEEYTTPDGDAMVRLLLVAAERDVVDSLVEVVQRARLRPVKLDLNAFAVLRALEGGHRLADDNSSEVLLDIGAGLTNLVVHARGEPRFVRVLVLGGDDITAALARELDLAVEEAEQVKIATGLQEFGSGGDAAAIIRERVDAFVREVRGSLDYFHARRGGMGAIDRLVLSGGGSLLAGIDARLSEVLRLPVDRAEVFERMPPVATDIAPEDLGRVGSVLTTSVGLALGAAA